MGRLSVLYVDDEPDLRDVAAMSLELDTDIEVQVAGNGPEALRLLADGACTPGVILLDVTMPEMDGPSVLARLRQTDQYATTPVIFVTARVQRQEIELFKSLGAIGVISKPYDPLKLAATVRSIMDAAA